MFEATRYVLEHFNEYIMVAWKFMKSDTHIVDWFSIAEHQIIDNESHDVCPPRETFHFFTSEFYEDSLHHFV